jgi:simple sugar transport system ATP-binding protein
MRCLLQTPKLLIMDEPTSVLTPQAVRKLFETLRQLAAEGCSILYISHKLDEIQELCHTRDRAARRQGHRHVRPVAGNAEVDGADDDRQGPAGAADTARRSRAGGAAAACRPVASQPTIRSARPEDIHLDVHAARSSASPACRATASRSLL